MFYANAWKWYGRASQPAGWHAEWSVLLQQFDCGVLTALRIPGRLAHLVADLKGLFASEPIESIAFDGAGARAAQIQALRRLAIAPRPVRLTFRPNRTWGDPVGYLVTALSSPFALSAISVDATACSAGAALGLVIARSPFIPNVTELAIDSNRLDVVAAMALAKSNGLRQVERFTARRNEFGPRGEELLRERFGSQIVV